MRPLSQFTIGRCPLLAVVVLLCIYLTRAHAGPIRVCNDEATSCLSHGIIAFVQGDLDSAIENFSQATHLDRTCAAAFYQRAKAREHKKDIENAIIDYGLAIEANPEYVGAYYYRACLYQQVGSLNEAIADYAAIIGMEGIPEEFRANAYNNRGLAYFKQKLYDRAIDDFTHAIEMLPSQVNAYYNRGACRAQQGTLPLAQEDFIRELSLHPSLFRPLHYSRAISYYDAKQYLPSWCEIQILRQVEEEVSPFLVEEVRKGVLKKKS